MKDVDTSAVVAAYHSRMQRVMLYCRARLDQIQSILRFGLPLALCKYGILINLGQSFKSHEISLSGLTPRALGLLAVDLVEHCFQTLLERLVLGTLVELADKVSADLECVVAEVESCPAEILGSVSAIWGASIWTSRSRWDTINVPYSRRGLETHSRSCSSTCSTGY